MKLHRYTKIFTKLFTTMTRDRKTASVHLYMSPNTTNAANIFTDGDQRDIELLLITASRLSDTFHDALLATAEWISSDEYKANFIFLDESRRK